MATDHALPPNAFLHPNNPFAVFPQTKKPDLMDFRSHKMGKKGGLVAVGTFRKIGNPNVKQSKYATIVKTNEMLEMEELERQFAAAQQEQVVEENEPLHKTSSSKVTTVAELAEMTAQLEIGKKKKAKGRKEDVEMPTISVKSKGIKKKGSAKRLRK